MKFDDLTFSHNFKIPSNVDADLNTALPTARDAEQASFVPCM